ncbi:hypothetical protein ElyMa_006900800 [Elysia marginata]|uniref:Uncharacterized protein n=1 Tax=Elysia marginata TaxID=1093978 RepID=A0AAV4JFC7_9GAST|nr:hypothetical protein ElyMa_006900800 [Elysia marginata]
MLSSIETGSPAVFWALTLAPTLTYRLSARPAVSEVSRMHSSSSSPARIICFSCIHVITSSYFIIIFINMSGKIIMKTFTIIIIITNGNLSINISSHTEKKTKIAIGSAKLWKLWNLERLGRTTFENIFVKSLLFHMQRTADVTVLAKQQYLGISAF